MASVTHSIILIRDLWPSSGPIQPTETSHEKADLRREFNINYNMYGEEDDLDERMLYLDSDEDLELQEPEKWADEVDGQPYNKLPKYEYQNQGFSFTELLNASDEETVQRILARYPSEYIQALKGAQSSQQQFPDLYNRPAQDLMFEEDHVIPFEDLDLDLQDIYNEPGDVAWQPGESFTSRFTRAAQAFNPWLEFQQNSQSYQNYHVDQQPAGQDQSQTRMQLQEQDSQSEIEEPSKKRRKIFRAALGADGRPQALIRSPPASMAPSAGEKLVTPRTIPMKRLEGIRSAYKTTVPLSRAQEIRQRRWSRFSGKESK